jgi:hypothetical protein
MSETITTSTLAGTISATARLRRYDARRDAQPRPWLGLDGGTPELVLADLSLIVVGQRVPIPRSVYADFGDFGFHSQFLAFASGGDRLFLTYSGGDAAGSFSADFVVRGTQLEEVRIHTPTFEPPGTPSQQTEVRTVPTQ